MDPKAQVKEMDVGVKPEGPPVIDFNQATAEELKALPGIGSVLARRIVAYREEQGGFRSPEELAAVPGISHATYERLAGRLTVTLPETPPPPTAEEAPPEEKPLEPVSAPPEAPPSQEVAYPEAEEAVLEEERVSSAEEVTETALAMPEAPAPITTTS